MIVVVGAGVSGLSAAVQLKKAGKQVLVIEVGNYVGGRTCTEQVHLPDGSIFNFDLGASWIHNSCQSHPVTKLAQQAGLVTKFTDDEESYLARDPQGEDVKDKLQEKIKKYHKMIKGMQDLEQEQSVLQFMTERVGEQLQDPEFMHYVSIDIEFETSADISQMSAKTIYADDEFDGTEQVVVNGYQRLSQFMVSKYGLEVWLHARVVAVQNTGGQTKIFLQDGRTVAAKSVIFSVPLTVLQRQAIQFNPPLSQGKREALGKIQMGSVCKILIIPNGILFDGEEHYLSYVAPADQRGLCCYFLNLRAVAGVNVMMTFGLGAFADVAQTMPEPDLKNLLAGRLTALCGKQVSPAMFEIKRTEWRTRFGGTYTFPNVGAQFQDWEMVAEPVFDCDWYFCGEHTTFRYRGSVHGAMLSGRKAAADILSGKHYTYIDRKWWDDQ